ncbi:hypothetical protein AB0C38_10370 [Amycolatopsis sp. NPDC048633]|uniref:hypothetical protein n=1 Tax=Amycolatopsis sp. NPDC048633 TaxID=3157095 RepID=UPI0033EAD8EF
MLAVFVAIMSLLVLVVFGAGYNRETDWWASAGQWVGGLGSIAAAIVLCGSRSKDGSALGANVKTTGGKNRLRSSQSGSTSGVHQLGPARPGCPCQGQP